ALLLLLDLWPLDRLYFFVQGSRFNVRHLSFSPILLEKLPFLALSLASSLITVHVQSQGGAVSSMTGVSIPARIANAISSGLKYLGKTFWPTNLSVYYPHPALDHSQWPFWEILAGCLALAAITALALLRLRRNPWLAVGWFWFLITLLPVIG